MFHRRTLCVLALLAVVASGCRLGVGAEVEVTRDGSGSAALALTLDAELLAALDDLALDPTAELTAVAATEPAWELTREATDDGALELTLRRDADDPDALTDALRELTAGLDERDPALLVDLDLTVDEDGAAELAGQAQLRPPVGPGVLTDDAAAAELEQLTTDHVDATLTVTLPGPVTATDADAVEGTTSTWSLTPGEARTVSARSAPPPVWPPERIAVVAAAAALAAAVLALVVVLWRRRRRAEDLSRAG